ncbi:hypothetical protein ACS3UN_10275 [Oscillospiraceae bacterium LTW-04]|nr:hypothetical protein RBH76_12025 [Oscillospiraceae bacterium MB24-C1]
MSLALLIEIEDKKEQLSQIDAQLDEKIRDKAAFELALACHNFRKFFETHHFKVEETLEEGNRALTAQYGGLKATLHYNSAQQHKGAYAVLYLSVKLSRNEKYKIVLQRKDSARLDVNVASLGYSLKDTPEVQQGQELDRLQKQIEANEERLAHFQQEQWTYTIMTDKNSPSDSFNSIMEILVYLIR